MLARALSVVLLAAACTPPPDPAVDRYFNIRPASESPLASNPRWTIQRYATDSGAICLDGSEYRTAFRAGPSNMAMLFLNGGGACWNDIICKAEFAARKAQAPESKGILSDDDPFFSSWNVLFASYCDGSVFAGDNDVTYPPSGDVRHHGVQNLSAALMALKEKVPNPDKLLIVGVSAGGFGTLMAMSVARAAFPETPFYVMDDSGPGLTNQLNPLHMQNLKDNWKLMQSVPDDCTECDPQFLPIVPYWLQKDPLLKRFGLFSSYEDNLIGQKFLLMTGPQYRMLLTSEAEKVSKAQPERFKRFFVNGDRHTILMDEDYSTLEVEEVSVRDWVEQLVSDDPGWADRLE